MSSNVLMLRYGQHLTLKEIASVTGLSVNTVAVQIHRALKKLRILYEQPVIKAGVVLLTMVHLYI